MEEYVPSPILRYFDYHHLLPHLAVVSEPFYNLAVELDKTLPDESEEKAVALRKLLESKDAAVRSVI